MLDELLDRLALKAYENKMPFTVQICLNDESGLLITVGNDISHMEFYSNSNRPPVVVSIGNWNETQLDEVFVALHGGEPSTVQKKSCVPIEYARDAVRQYLETGNRPTNVNWSE